MSVPLAQIPGSARHHLDDAGRAARPVGTPPYRGTRVPPRHAHAVDPQARARQARVALHGGRGVRAAGRARLSGVAARFRVLRTRAAGRRVGDGNPARARGGARADHDRRRLAAAQHAVHRRAARAQSGARLSAAALARRRSDHQRAAHARPAKRRADARHRHAAGLSAAAPAVADAARRTGNRRVARSDRDGVRHHAGDRPDLAHLRETGRCGDRRRSGVVPDVRPLRVAGRAAGRHAVHARRPGPRRARNTGADVAARKCW